MRACSVSEQDVHIPLDRRTFLQWLSRWWRGQHESGSPSFSISREEDPGGCCLGECLGPATLAGTEDPKGGPILESIANFHAVAVCQIFQAATRIVKWPGVKGNLRIALPLEQNAG